jgi:hypothetical protein
MQSQGMLISTALMLISTPMKSNPIVEMRKLFFLGLKFYHFLIKLTRGSLDIDSAFSAIALNSEPKEWAETVKLWEVSVGEANV